MKHRPVVRFVLVLHGHLPYVRHPEREFFLEENWLFEAVTESYLPLLGRINRLIDDGVPCPFSLSISPPLVEMLGDELLRKRCSRYIAARRALSEDLAAMHRGSAFEAVARMYADRFRSLETVYETRLGRDVVSALGALTTAGIELMTTSATHAFLPFLAEAPEAVSAQLGISEERFRRTFGEPSPGLWLPECAYYRGLDEAVMAAGFRHTVLDAHAFLFGRPMPEHGPFEPARTPGGLIVLGRDPFTCAQVWASNGYPSDPNYREFHWDMGFEIPEPMLKRYVHPDGHRMPSGLKFYRVTGGDRPKEPYDRDRALDRTREHARHFVNLLCSRAEMLRQEGLRHPVIVCAFDAELFGHWWFEGPEWLEEVFRRLVPHRDLVRPATVGEAAGHGSSWPVIDPSPSSWGEGGFGEVWLSPETDWMYPRLHAAARELVKHCSRSEAGRRSGKRAGKQTGNSANPSGEMERLELAARELLLAQASDWAFLIRQNSASQYARRRVEDHLRRFDDLMAVDQPACNGLTAYGRDLFTRTRCTSFFRREDLRRDRPSEIP